MIEVTDAGLVLLVREFMLECLCERGEPEADCVGPANRNWVLDALLDDEERREWNRRHVGPQGRRTVQSTVQVDGRNRVPARGAA